MKIKSQLVPRDWNPHKAIYDIKAIPETWTIQKLLEEYFTTYIDYAFQRPYTWTENDVMEFITSIIRNNLRSKITIASPQDCANFVKKLAPLEAPSVNYFQKIINKTAPIVNKKYNGISIDGMGRTTSAIAFMLVKAMWPKKSEGFPYTEELKYTFEKDDRFKTDEIDENGNKIEFVYTFPETRKLKFSEFPDELKAIMLNRKISIDIITKATEMDCHREFIIINKNHIITPQDSRQAIPSTYSEWLRKSAKKHFFLTNHSTKVKVQGRSLDQFLHTCYMYRGDTKKRKSGFSGKTILDQPYKYQKTLTELNYIESTTIINGAFTLLKKYDKEHILHDIGTIFNWYMYYVWCKETNQKIHNEKRLVELFLTVHTTAYVDKNKKWYVEQKDMGFAGLCTSMMPRKTIPRLHFLIEKMNEALCRSENKNIMTIVEPYEKDINRLFNRHQKFIMWKMQDGNLPHYDNDNNFVPYKDATCPCCGKKIPYREIYDGTKWGGDHYPVDYEDGGKTVVNENFPNDETGEIHNGRLICQSKNKKRGGRPLKEVPYKPVTEHAEIAYV